MGRLVGAGAPTAIPARLMIAVLGGLADLEPDLIRTRTAEGRSRAKRVASTRVPSSMEWFAALNPAPRNRLLGQALLSSQSAAKS